MTDLETACRELVDYMNQSAENLRYAHKQTGKKSFELRAGDIEKFANKLEKSVEEHTELDPEVKTLVEQMEDAT